MSKHIYPPNKQTIKAKDIKLDTHLSSTPHQQPHNKNLHGSSSKRLFLARVDHAILAKATFSSNLSDVLTLWDKNRD